MRCDRCGDDTEFPHHAAGYVLCSGCLGGSTAVEMSEMIDHFARADGIAPAAIEKGVNIAKVCDRINQLYQDSTGHRLPWAWEIQLAVIIKEAIDQSHDDDIKLKGDQ